MTGNRLGATGLRVVVDVVAGSVAQQHTPGLLQFREEIPSLHAISNSTSFLIPGIAS